MLPARLRAFQFPDAKQANRVNTHHLESLLKEAELDRELGKAPADVRESWTVVKDWRVDRRYESGTSEAECRDFLVALTGQGGFMQWLRLFW